MVERKEGAGTKGRLGLCRKSGVSVTGSMF